MCLGKVAKAVSHSLNNCVNCLPGQKDVDVALKSIGESSKKLLVESVSRFPVAPASEEAPCKPLGLGCVSASGGVP